MNAVRRAKTRTSIEIPFEDDAPDWLSHLKLTRDGHEIYISLIKTNGSSYQTDPICLAEFNKMIDTLLDP